MGNNSTKTRTMLLRITIVIFLLAMIVFVIWLDIARGWWAETVILSGIASGILTFFLTALFIERWMANREHRKWVPVTRLALSDILHAMADDDQSDISRGRIVARSLKIPAHEHAVKELSNGDFGNVGAAGVGEGTRERASVAVKEAAAPGSDLTKHQLQHLLHQVVRERNAITKSLARWAQFLASSADVQNLMIHIADVAEDLDYTRDCIVGLEESKASHAGKWEAELRASLDHYSESADRTIREILSLQEVMSRKPSWVDEAFG